VPTSYVPANHPAFDSNISEIPYDPEIGNSLLEQAGWLDNDNNPATPRRAINVRNVAYNAPLELNYYTTSTAQRRQVTAILEESLAECGIGLNVQYFSQNDLYAPQGMLLGRQFDLAEYALGIESVEPACNWFTTAEIPAETNSWSGTNITGFSNAAYDLACNSARTSLRDEQNYLNQYRQTQIIFSEQLPAIPLFFRLRIAAARPEVCGFSLDSTANPLANIEGIGIGTMCE
jgi:peptide/nickel transport system substrate-binding protein